MIFALSALGEIVCAQDSVASTFAFTYEVNRVYPSVSIKKKALADAQNLSDLNRRYEADWVRKYLLVEFTAIRQGKNLTISGESDVLTDAQKDLLLHADSGTEVRIRVKYMPENNLKHNEAKEMSFNLYIDPQSDAHFIGGDRKLQDYLKRNAIGLVATEKFKQYQLAAYKFTVAEDGSILNPHVLWSSEDEQIDEVMLSAICNMPRWNPAQYSDGTNVHQDYVLSVGDKQSCTMNLLHIKP